MEMLKLLEPQGFRTFEEDVVALWCFELVG